MIAVELSRDNNWVAMRIDGHTDSTGSNKYNDELSYDRAVEYAMHLVAKNGIDPNRVFVKGFGEEKPIAPNDQVEGRSQNRRVELLILVPTE
jgi:outer membrane protein OmpA-like peptidoglycan-associated protein